MQRISARRRLTLAVIATAALVAASASAAYVRSPDVSEAVTAAVPTKAEALVRNGSTGVLVEQFASLNARPPLGLRAWTYTTDTATITKLVLQLNSLPPFPDRVFCPIDDGSYDELEFTYDNGITASIQIDDTGCQAVNFKASDQLIAWAAMSPDLFVTLNGLLRPSGASRATSRASFERAATIALW